MMHLNQKSKHHMNHTLSQTSLSTFFPFFSPMKQSLWIIAEVVFHNSIHYSQAYVDLACDSKNLMIDTYHWYSYTYILYQTFFIFSMKFKSSEGTNDKVQLTHSATITQWHNYLVFPELTSSNASKLSQTFVPLMRDTWRSEVSPPNRTKILRIPSCLLFASGSCKEFDLLGQWPDTLLNGARLGNLKHAWWIMLRRMFEWENPTFTRKGTLWEKS